MLAKTERVREVDKDGNMGVGFYRKEADAWDNSCFGWLERDSEDECPRRLGKVIAWAKLPAPPVARK